MSFTIPTHLSRVFRPFTTSALHAVPEGSGAQSLPPNAEKATFAAGCFWGVEHIFRKKFGNRKGLVDAKVGYIGGDTSHPTYRNVCSGNTGHAEALQITYDPSLVGYRELLEFFYRMHDPTTANAQGPDVGTQYRSAIFFHSIGQERLAREVTDKVQRQWYKDAPVTTQIVPAGQWWDAEDYHQLYLDKNPMGYECPSHFVRDFPPLE